VSKELSVEIHTDHDAFAALEPEWAGLLRRSSANTVFLTWEWQSIWWDWFGEQAQLSILAARDDGELVGLAPLYSLPAADGPRSLQFVGGVEVSDYLDLLVVADGRAEKVYSSLWDFLTNEYGAHWDVLDLHNVPSLSPTLKLLPALAARSSGVEVTSGVEEVCPIITLPSTWEDYLAMLNKKQRHEVRRKVRKASREAAVRWQYSDNPATLDKEVDEFVRLHRQSGGHKKAFMDERMHGFFREVAHAAFDRGWLRLAFLVVNDTQVASMFCFEWDHVFMVYNSGYNPHLYPSLSTGIVLLAHCIRDAIERGLKAFDFLRGEEDYKYRFGGVRTEIYNLRLARQGSNNV
jgi:CelD/BcsL family acetyltransferase involved in cellulose biosynthesis